MKKKEQIQALFKEIEELRNLVNSQSISVDFLMNTPAARWMDSETSNMRYGFCLVCNGPLNNGHQCSDFTNNVH